MGLGKKIRKNWWEMCARCSAGRRLSSQSFNLEAPLRVSGKGVVSIGRGTTIGYFLAPKVGDGGALLQPRRADAKITIGNHCALSNNVTMIANSSILVGNDCLIGDQVFICDSDFHGVEPWRRHEVGVTAPVVLGNNVWIGSRAIILKGVIIGDNSVVAAGAVVVKPVPPNSVVGGNPAKVIRMLDAQP